MADYYAYNADVWCPTCTEAIKEQRAKEVAEKMRAVLDAEFPKCNFSNQFTKDLVEQIRREMDGYGEIRDTDNWPQSGSFEPTDCPQHCASGETCLEAEVLSSEFKVGALLGTELTEQGLHYTNELMTAPRQTKFQKALSQFWRVQFSQYEFGDPE